MDDFCNCLPVSNNSILNPFNLEPDAYNAMFESPAPSTLVMPIALFVEPGMDRTAELDEKCHLIMDAVTQNIGRCAIGNLQKQIRKVPDKFNYIAGDRQAVTWSLLPDYAKEWAHDGIFVEAGYYNHITAGANPREQEILNAMMLYDVAVAEAGSIEPCDQHPLLVGEQFAREWTDAVDDLYLAKVGVWCRELVEHRNMLLIIARAVLMGRDPVTEYHLFKDAGGQYFLEYPTLCP